MSAKAIQGSMSLGAELFGKGSTQEQQGTTVDQLRMRPEDLARLEAQRAQVQAGTGQFSDLAAMLQRQALGAAPTLQQIQGPQFSTELDPFARRLAAQGTEQLQQAASAQGRQAQQQLGGLQPAVAKALALQAGQRARLQANPLLMAAAKEQQGRQMGQQQMLLSAQQMENQRRLQQAQAGGQARQQALGFGSSGLQAQSNLLGQLSQLGSQLGAKTRTSDTKGKSRTGGLFTGV